MINRSLHRISPASFALLGSGSLKDLIANLNAEPRKAPCIKFSLRGACITGKDLVARPCCRDILADAQMASEGWPPKPATASWSNISSDIDEDTAPVQPAGYRGLLCGQEITNAALRRQHGTKSQQLFLSATGQLASHCLGAHQEQCTHCARMPNILSW